MCIAATETLIYYTDRESPQAPKPHPSLRCDGRAVQYIYIYIQDTIIINSYKYSYGFWNCRLVMRLAPRTKINFSMAGAREKWVYKSRFRETKPYIFSVRWALSLGRHVEKSVDAKYVFWTLSYIFSVRFHFPLASRGKSENAKYIRSGLFVLF